MLLTKKYNAFLAYFFIVITAIFSGRLLINRPTLFILFFSACVIAYYSFLNRTDLLFLMLAGIILCIPWQKPSPGGWGIPSANLFNIAVPFTFVVITFFIFLFILISLINKPEKLQQIPLFKPFISFFIVCLISSVLGLDANKSLWFLFFQFLIPAFCIFYGSYLACKDQKTLLHIILGLILLISLIALYAIFEFLIKSNPIEAFFAPRFPAQWSPYSYVESIHKYYLVISTVGSSTFLGSVLIAGICLAGGYFLYAKTIFKKFIFLCSVLICLIALGLTTNRGGILSLMVTIFIFILLIGRKEISKFLLYLVLPSLFIAVCFILAFAFTAVESRFILEDILAGHSTIHRITAYRLTLEFLKYNPLFGIGIGNFEEMQNRLITAFTLETPTMDNMFLAVLSYTGIIGLILFSILLLSLFKKLIVGLKRLVTSDIHPIFVSFFCALIGLLVSFCFYDAIGHVAVSFMFWSLAGIGVAVAQETK
jgi:O-antigen ligase